MAADDVTGTGDPYEDDPLERLERNETGSAANGSDRRLWDARNPRASGVNISVPAAARHVSNQHRALSWVLATVKMSHDYGRMVFAVLRINDASFSTIGAGIQRGCSQSAK